MQLSHLPAIGLFSKNYLLVKHISQRKEQTKNEKY